MISGENIMSARIDYEYEMRRHKHEMLNTIGEKEHLMSYIRTGGRTLRDFEETGSNPALTIVTTPSNLDAVANTLLHELPSRILNFNMADARGRARAVQQADVFGDIKISTDGRIERINIALDIQAVPKGWYERWLKSENYDPALRDEVTEVIQGDLDIFRVYSTWAGIPKGTARKHFFSCWIGLFQMAD
jgi:hypothetical protein